MSRILSTGFENGNLNHSSIGMTSGASIISSTGLNMDGNYCLECSNVIDYCTFNLPNAVEYYFSFLYRGITESSNQNIIQWIGNGDATRSGSIYRASTTGLLSFILGTTIITSNGNLSSGKTYLIKIYVKIDNSNGRVIVNVNGSNVIDYTGNTKYSTETIINKVNFGYNMVGATNGYGYSYYDNIIVDTTAWPVGNPKIQGFVPTGVGTTNTFTYGTYTDVDEVPANEVSGLKTNTAGHIATFTHPALSGVVTSINAISVYGVAVVNGNPTPKNIQLGIHKGGSDYFADDKLVPFVTSQALYRLMETDPSTGIAWTESGINTAEIGVKSVA